MGTGAPVAGMQDRTAADAAAGVDKRRYVRRIFSEIAPRYDLLNHLLSLNIDRLWRRRAIAALDWGWRPGGTYLDLCAGTLDVALALGREPAFAGTVIGADFAEPMLRAGMAKSHQGGVDTAVRPVVADALQLPLADRSLAGAIVAFGIRNVDDLGAAFREVHRVLVPGARFVVLEFTTPSSSLVRVAYHTYFHHVVPAIGAAVSGHPTAYRYLPQSVAHFPDARTLADHLREAGFANVTWRSLTGGIAALHVGERP
jgi:demethylmenaquinone methyltransferase / 2-methoxy-6-polyprenyl-1,4-benzoquinol methylase